jgi:hypothetical protein
METEAQAGPLGDTPSWITEIDGEFVRVQAALMEQSAAA